MSECSITKCKAACCTFMTWQMPTTIPDDAVHWLNLHGIEVKHANNGATHLKIPVPCQALDPVSLRCKVYEQRPMMCREYPLFESPFIPKENCSLLDRKEIASKP